MKLLPILVDALAACGAVPSSALRALRRPRMNPPYAWCDDCYRYLPLRPGFFPIYGRYGLVAHVCKSTRYPKEICTHHAAKPEGDPELEWDL